MKKGLESKEAKERKQKESHSEIERKRRERMKKETEYLNQQLPDAERKDKLSVFQAGCEQLIYYTDSLDKRDYILNDSEYTSIISKNFSGFDMHIRCSDSKILHVHENISDILGQEKGTVENCVLYDLCEPSKTTTQLVMDTLTLTSTEKRLCSQGELIRRELTLPIRAINPHLNAKCVPSSDNCWYRFVEMCGEIYKGDKDTIAENDSAAPLNPVLRVLCRPIDPGVSYGGCGGDAHMHITTKHSPDTFRITEVTGHVQVLLGMDAQNLINKEFSDMVPNEERSYVKKNFQDALKTGSILFICPLVHESGEQVRFRIQLTAIDINGKVQFIIAKSVVANTDVETPQPSPYSRGMKQSPHSRCTSVESSNSGVSGPGYRSGLSSSPFTSGMSPSSYSNEMKERHSPAFTQAQCPPTQMTASNYSGNHRAACDKSFRQQESNGQTPIERSSPSDWQHDVNGHASQSYSHSNQSGLSDSSNHPPPHSLWPQSNGDSNSLDNVTGDDSNYDAIKDLLDGNSLDLALGLFGSNHLPDIFKEDLSDLEPSLP